MCPKAADVFAKSGRCPLRTKAADVENIYFEIFGAKAADVPQVRKRPIFDFFKIKNSRAKAADVP